jgi:hypothetical protein
MQLAVYANWVQGEVNQLTPDQVMRNWGAMWNNTLTQLYNLAAGVTAVYEHAAMVAARWEFLGALYLGSSGKTDVAGARQYADKFLPAYGPLHNMSGAGQPGQSEFFSVFRNKCLHGFTPAGVWRAAGGGDVVGWSIGAHQPGAHLQYNAAASLQVDSASLQAQLIQSISDYSAYLAANADAAFPLTPQARWKKGFWGRFCPVNFAPKVWEQDGRTRGLYP